MEERTDRPYTAETLCREAGVSGSYVARLCRQGTLDCMRVGRQWIIDAEEGRRWIRERRDAQNER
jgi:excisionase family DNA binding protein